MTSKYYKGNKGKKSGKEQSSTKKPKAKKTVTDYVYYIGSATQASDCTETTQFMLNHIIKTFDYGIDIAKSIDSGKKVNTDDWKPKMKSSDLPDGSAKDAQNEQFKIEFKSELDEYLKRTKVHTNNLNKAYALLWERCSKGMQNKISSRKDYDSIKQDPIALKKAIEEHAMNFQETRCEMGIMCDSMRTFFNAKQKDNESLADCSRRFKAASKVMTSHLGGPLFLKKCVEQCAGHDEANRTAVKSLTKDACDSYAACIFLQNADQAKCGSFATHLATRKALNYDEHPKNVSDMSQALNDHKHDNCSEKKRNPKKGNDDKGGQQKPEDDFTPTMTFAQIEKGGKKICYCCGKTGHLSPECRHNSKPKEEWCVNKVQQGQSHAQLDGKKVSFATVEKKSDEKQTEPQSAKGWCGANVNDKEESECHDKDLFKWIPLDNQSSAHLFCNKQHVKNIRRVNECMSLNANGGLLTTNLKGDVSGVGEVWHSPKAITNVASFAQARDKHLTTHTTDDTFVLHLNKSKILFGRQGTKLHFCKPTTELQFLNTVEENKKFYAKRQFEAAKRARNLLHALGSPSISDFKALVRMNVLKNNPVVLKDIELATDIFGPDISGLKGKTTRRKPLPVVEDQVQIPQELVAKQRNVTIAMVEDLHSSFISTTKEARGTTSNEKITCVGTLRNVKCCSFDFGSVPSLEE